MRVALEELVVKLSNSAAQLPKLLLLNANEPLFLEEALDGAREVYQQAGYSERVRYQAEAGFDWSQIQGAGQSMSLFSEKRIIELRVPKSLGVAGTKALAQYSDNLAEDDVLIVLMPALDKRQRTAKWCKAVDYAGWLVDGFDISAQQFPSWLKKRLQSRALRVEAGVVELMTAQLEGNVLAAAQEVDKLRVLAKEGAVSIQLVTDSLADQARFDVYALADVVLKGDFLRALRIKQRLQSEGVEPVIVVWALVKEIRLISAIASGLAQGQSRAALFKQNRVWSKREPFVNAALQRFDAAQWQDLLIQAAYLDQTVKGQRYKEPGDNWYQIEQLCAGICGMPLASLKSA